MVRTAAGLYAYRFAEVEPLARAAQDVFASQCPGAFWEESICDALSSSALEVTGPLTQLRERAPMLMRRASERSDDFADAMLCRTFSLAQLLQDQPKPAIAFLQQRLVALGDVGQRELDLRRWLIIQCLADCQSYAGCPYAAWHALESIWQKFLNSPFERTDFIRAASHYRRGRVAVNLAASGSEQRWVRSAERHAHALSRMPNPASEASACSIRAALAAQYGELRDARRLLERAESASRSIGLVVPANATRRQYGRVVGGATGQRLVEQADAALRELGIVCPARWADTFISGFELIKRN
jgi:hypothetical protein